MSVNSDSSKRHNNSVNVRHRSSSGSVRVHHSPAPVRRHNSSPPHRAVKSSSERLFKKGFRIYMAILSVFFLILLVCLFVSLKKYEKTNDAADNDVQADSSWEEPQLYFENYISTMTLADWKEAWVDDKNDFFDSDGTIEEFISTYILTPGYICYEAPDYSVSAPSYVLKSSSDGSDLVTFSLTGRDNDWDVADISFALSGTAVGSVTVPAGTSVVCNGILLDDSYASQTEDSSNVSFSDDSLLTNKINYRTFTISGTIIEPVFEVSSTAEGIALSCDSPGHYTPVLSDSSVSEGIRNTSLSFISALLKYYADGKQNTSENMNTVLSYVPDDSEAAKVIKESYDGVIWRYPEDISYSTEVSEVYLLSDNCCYTFVTCLANSEGSEVNTYCIYFLDSGNGFKIYSFSYK